MSVLLEFFVVNIICREYFVLILDPSNLLNNADTVEIDCIRRKFQIQMMRMPVYLVCAALILAVKSDDESNYYGNQLEPMDLLPEDEPIRFLFPRLAKMRPNRNNWIDEQYYNVPDVQSNSIEQISLSSEGRFKRTEGMGGRLLRPSLSFSNSLDVLRDRLILEATRKQSQKDMTRNRARLCQIGKRSQMDQSGCNDLKSSRVFLN